MDQSCFLLTLHILDIIVLLNTLIITFLLLNEVFCRIGDKIESKVSEKQCSTKKLSNTE